ncbi:TonB-dependent receptor domain-containing protein [Arcobacter vandammei]|uniref:TonB-dependent receptor domain-containing protein n=1 Tax=Arcobacter vandammei TaxID=2782243 RepID=UPI001D191E55|nr:TonB-dependent receptor [Arcobacter vandammei]
MKIRLAMSVSAILLAGGGTLLSANETTKLDEVQVVTTAGGYEQNIADAAASISVITAEEIEKKSYTDVTDVLKNVPGVYVNGGGSNQSISIRGMSADYTLYMVDGKPMQDNQAFSPNGSHAGNPINFLPPLEAIERIEVIRGPASALYGSNAMGGVINIITKKHSDKVTANINLEYLKADSSNKVNNDSQNVSAFVNVPVVKDLLSVQLTAGLLNTDESDYKSSGALKAGSDPDYKRTNVGGKVILTPDEHNTITAGYNYKVQERTSNPGKSIAAKNEISGTTTTSIGGKDYIKSGDNYYLVDRSEMAWGRAVNGWSKQVLTHYAQTDNTKSYQKSINYDYNIAHEAKYDKVLVNSYLTYEKSKNPTRANATTGNSIEMDTLTLNTQGTYFFDTNSLTVGANYKKENLEDGATNAIKVNGVTDTSITKMDRYQWALFAEDTWSVTDDLALTLSGRYDKNEDFGSEFTPKAYAVYSLTDNLNLKGGVTTGYKAPSLRQAASNFAGISGGGGPAIAMVGNPDLKPEKSVNYEAGIAYDNSDLGLGGSLMLFQTNYKNKVQTTDAYNSDGTRMYDYKGENYPGGVKFYENVDKAEIKGIELTTDWYILENLKYRHSYTYTDSEQKTGIYKGYALNNLSKHMFNAGIDFDATSKLLLWTQVNYRSETAGSNSEDTTYIYRNNGTERSSVKTGKIKTTKTPSYTFVDLGAVYKYDKNLSFNAGIYNIANKDVTDDGNSNVLDGRRYSVAMNMKF